MTREHRELVILSPAKDLTREHRELVIARPSASLRVNSAKEIRIESALAR
jgi:hypothetical protein